MEQHFEAFFKGVHGDPLFYQFFPSRQASSLGSILLTHGQGEYGDMYLPLIHFLQDEGWGIFTWDMRGHGRSSGKRGFAHHFDDYIKDFLLFLQEIAKTRKEQSTINENQKKHPLVCFSHSMGALIQSKAFLMEKGVEKEVGICGQVISCPCFGIKMDVPKWKTYAGILTNKIYPKFTMGNGITDDQLMLEPEKNMRPAILRHRRTCFNVYKGIMESTDWLAKTGFGKVQIPTFMQLAGKEVICDNKKAKALFNQIKKAKKILKIYTQSRHEIYGDIEKEEVYNDLCLFLKELKASA